MCPSSLPSILIAPSKTRSEPVAGAIETPPEDVVIETAASPWAMSSALMFEAVSPVSPDHHLSML